ncbi:unnamed protein product [Dovyalis caffra]|uniref:Uncharacterized protein n=1 Tax=Dovyalis caffra TaxID=77055 RepID=A0AAV1SLS1_9ROSI|nr:unnamed protein product [Dovyalis caffra]
MTGMVGNKIASSPSEKTLKTKPPLYSESTAPKRTQKQRAYEAILDQEEIQTA